MYDYDKSNYDAAYFKASDKNGATNFFYPMSLPLPCEAFNTCSRCALAGCRWGSLKSGPPICYGREKVQKKIVTTFRFFFAQIEQCK